MMKNFSRNLIDFYRSAAKDELKYYTPEREEENHITMKFRFERRIWLRIVVDDVLACKVRQKGLNRALRKGFYF